MWIGQHCQITAKVSDYQYDLGVKVKVMVKYTFYIRGMACNANSYFIY